jgi:enediyne biosynthesis protein E4
VDLVVTQNGAETKLYRNTQAKPGLRVRLKGPAGNPTGAGAVLRLKFGDRHGPAREVHAGSGYGSQDSAVQVLGAAEPPTQIEIRWPNGQQTTADVPARAKEIELEPQDY